MGLFLFILAAACSCGTREKCNCPHFRATFGPASALVTA